MNQVRYLHTMLRVKDLDRSVEFFTQHLGLQELRRKEHPEGKFTLVFLATESGAPEVELTYNWDSSEEYSGGRNFGHLAYEVEDIYQKCAQLAEAGVRILRPPRDGRMAFVRTPDEISIELLQKGDALPKQEPWQSMENQGEW